MAKLQGIIDRASSFRVAVRAGKVFQGIAGIINASGLPVEAVNEIFIVTLDHEIFGPAIRKVNIGVTVLVLRARAASRNP